MPKINFPQNQIDVVAGEYNRLANAGLIVHGCKTHIAEKLGISPTELNRRLEVADKQGLLITSRYVPEAKKRNGRYDKIKEKDALKRLEMTFAAPPAHNNKVIRILGIGDAHDCPALPDKSRFKWMGKLAQNEQPDHIVQIGDFADFDSLNSHVRNDTLGGKHKTPFMQDIYSLREAMAEFNGPINYKPIKHITMGNHEQRAWRYEDTNPEVSGMLQHQITDSFMQAGWSWSEYGAWHFIEGVGFTHAPFHGGSSPKTQSPALVSIANKLRWDAVMGHTHKKIDTQHESYGGRPISTINLGCALPQDYIFPYAEHGLNSWFWGCAIITIRNGCISETQWFSMATLQERYGR